MRRVRAGARLLWQGLVGKWKGERGKGKVGTIGYMVLASGVGVDASVDQVDTVQDLALL